MPVDMNRYPKNWKEISQRIRIRAEGTCECEGECGTHHGRCTASNYGLHPITGSKVILTVAHLGHTTGNKHDKMDVRDENLKAMCQRCHLLFDLDEHIENARKTRNTKKLQAFIDAGQLQMGL
jgi:hypothetical protein